MTALTTTTTGVNVEAFRALPREDQIAHWRTYSLETKFELCRATLKMLGKRYDSDTVMEAVEHWNAKWQVAPSPIRKVVFERETRDYALYLDGELVGYARTEREGYTTLAALVSEQLARAVGAPQAELAEDDVEACSCRGDGECPRCDAYHDEAPYDDSAYATPEQIAQRDAENEADMDDWLRGSDITAGPVDFVRASHEAGDMPFCCDECCEASRKWHCPNCGDALYLQSPCSCGASTAPSDPSPPQAEPVDWNDIAQQYARACQINLYHARADVGLRRRENGDEEAARWFARFLAGELITWNTRCDGGEGPPSPPLATRLVEVAVGVPTAPEAQATPPAPLFGDRLTNQASNLLTRLITEKADLIHIPRYGEGPDAALDRQERIARLTGAIHRAGMRLGRRFAAMPAPSDNVPQPVTLAQVHQQLHADRAKTAAQAEDPWGDPRTDEERRWDEEG